MSILSRFSDIMASNINALLDKMEDPSKMIDQTMRKAKEDLAEVKSETAAVMAEEKRCARLVNEYTENVAKYTDLAKKALASGNEDDARTFLTRKQEAEAQLASASQAYTVAAANSGKMRQMHDKLVTDINALDARRNNIKATMSVAKTQERMNKMTEAVNSSRGSLDTFARMEAKANEALDKAMAKAELNGDINDSTKELEDKYSAGGSVSVDDELARLKAELGM